MRFSFQSTLLIWFFIGTYLNLSLFIKEGVFIPNVIAYITGAVLLIMHFNKLIIKKYSFFLIGFLIISFLSILFSPKLVNGVLKEQFLSFAQLFLSLFVSIGVFFTLNRLGPKKVSKIISIFLLVLLLGALLERVLYPIEYVSDLFRHNFYAADLYIADKRDVNMVGFIRPKFFAREPSLLTQFIMLFSVFWYLLTKFNYKNSAIFCIIIASIFITGSLKILILLPLMLVLNLGGIKRLLIKYHILSFSVLGIIIIIISLASIFLFDQRFYDVFAGKDQSFNIRILVPLFVMASLLVKYPVFGLGLGGKENSLGVFANKFEDLGYHWISENTFTANFHSYVLETIYFYGFLGTFLIVVLFNKSLLSEFNTKHKFLFWSLLLIIGLTGGSVPDLRTWLVVMLLYFCVNSSQTKTCSF